MLFLVNPYAGMRKVNRQISDILTIFNQADYEVCVHITAGRGDCAQITAQRAHRFDAVVCAGGDGTFNEAINGVLRSGADVPLGYIPCGSTNDFANSLHLPTNILQAARNIVEGTPVAYDVGKFDDRYFSYVASFGAFTRASYATPQNVKNALGHTAYILGGISELSQLHKEHLRIETEDQIIEDDFLFGAISNSTSMGGILTLDPKQVDMQDGKFELLLIRNPKNLAEISECILALQRQQYNCSMMTFLSARTLKITADPNMPWTLDGEMAEGRGHIQAENLHHAIRLLKKE